MSHPHVADLAVGLKAYQVMSHPLFTVTTGDPLDVAASVFLENNISAAPVMDKSERAIGVITKTDLARYERARASGERIESETVEAWMTPTVFSVGPEAPISDVCRDMIKNGIHHLFVADEETGHLIGVISSFDLLKVLADFLRRSLS